MISDQQLVDEMAQKIQDEMDALERRQFDLTISFLLQPDIQAGLVDQALAQEAQGIIQRFLELRQEFDDNAISAREFIRAASDLSNQLRVLNVETRSAAFSLGENLFGREGDRCR